jgi:hypothetical protein
MCSRAKDRRVPECAPERRSHARPTQHRACKGSRVASARQLWSMPIPQPLPERTLRRRRSSLEASRARSEGSTEPKFTRWRRVTLCVTATIAFFLVGSRCTPRTIAATTGAPTPPPSTSAAPATGISTSEPPNVEVEKPIPRSPTAHSALAAPQSKGRNVPRVPHGRSRLGRWVCPVHGDVFRL